MNQNEAKSVETIFQLYVQLGCLNKVMRETTKMGLRSKRHHFKSGRTQGGNPFSRGQIYALLRNPIYIGKSGINPTSGMGSMTPSSTLSYGIKFRLSCRTPVFGQGRGSGPRSVALKSESHL